MLKTLRAIRQTLRDRRDYADLLSKLERIKAENVNEMDRCVASRPARQVLGGNRR